MSLISFIVISQYLHSSKGDQSEILCNEYAQAPPVGYLLDEKAVTVDPVFTV